MIDKPIPVLDSGYVRLVDSLGSDLSVVNAARASFMKESIEFSDKDERLIKFLIRENHTAPLRHAFLSFEIKAPLFVARQWWKYAIASNHMEFSQGWSEASRRYVTLEPEFYMPQPGEWRSAPENKKQGSGGPIDTQIGTELTINLSSVIEMGLRCYNAAIEAGAAVEQARGFLPAYFLYTAWRWSASLQTVLHFLKERLAHDAQFEISLYAQAVAEIVSELFPATYEAMLSC